MQDTKKFNLRRRPGLQPSPEAHHVKVTRNVAGTQRGNSCEHWLHKSKKVPRRRWFHEFGRCWRLGGRFCIKIGREHRGDQSDRRGEQLKRNELYHQCCTFMRSKMGTWFLYQKGQNPHPKEIIAFPEGTDRNTAIMDSSNCKHLYKEENVKMYTFCTILKRYGILGVFPMQQSLFSYFSSQTFSFQLHTCYYNRDMPSTWDRGLAHSRHPKNVC